MIRRSRVMFASCAGAALALHGAGLWLSDSQRKIEIAGGAGAVEVTLGNSFADMTAGVVQPVSDTRVTPNRQAETEVDPAEPGAAIRPDIARTPAVTPPDDPVEQPQPKVAEISPMPDRQESNRAQEAAATALTEALESVVETAEPIRPSAPVATPPAGNRQPAQIVATPPRDTPKTAEAAPKEVIEAQPEADQGLQVSRRPQVRPREIEQAAARQSPEPERREARTRSRQGNNAERDATRGSATGHEATAAQQGRDTSRRSEAQGNAEASNYPGEVMRHLARVPRPRAASRGAALVRFSIGAGGRLASVALARSSGSSRLDRVALSVVQRAAPFPAPPSGAQRKFSVKIEGR